MIADAIDTVVTLGWALAVWILLLAAVATLAGWTVVVTVAWVARGLWRGVVAASAAMAPRRPLDGRLSAELPPSVNPYTGAPERRTAAHVPTWAQPDEEAA